MGIVYLVTFFYVHIFCSIFDNVHGSSFFQEDRIPSTDSRVGRLFYLSATPDQYATGFLTSTGWCVSSGSFFQEYYDGGHQLMKMEFNVPLSKPNGDPNHSSIHDVYSVDLSSATYSTGDGSDWSVFRLLPNSNTGKTAFETQGSFFRFVGQKYYAHATSEYALSNTGYSLIGPPPKYGVGEGSFRNQYSCTQLTCNAGVSLDQHGSEFRSIFECQSLNRGSPIILQGTDAVFSVYNRRDPITSIVFSSAFQDSVIQSNDFSIALNQTFFGSAFEAYSRNYVDANAFATVNDERTTEDNGGGVLNPYRNMQICLAQLTEAADYNLLIMVSGNYPITTGITFPSNIALGAVAGPVSFYATSAPSANMSLIKNIQASRKPKKYVEPRILSPILNEKKVSIRRSKSLMCILL